MKATKMDLKSKFRLTGIVLLTAATLIGLWATLVRFSEGLIVTNMTQHIPWGLWVACYIYAIGLSAGSFLLSTLIYVFGVHRLEAAGKLALLQALLCMFLGLWMIFVDLGHPERFLNVLTSTNPTSVLAWEAWAYIAYVVVILSEMYFAFRKDFVLKAKQGTVFYQKLLLGYDDLSESALQKDRKYLQILGAIGIPIAILVHGGTGAIFAVAKARPAWFSGLFPIIFLVSALASGGALLTFLTAALFKQPQEEKLPLVQSLAKLTAGILCFDLLLFASEILVTFYGSIPQEVVSWKLTLFGPYWEVFWFVQLGFGTLIPLAIIFCPKTNQSITWLGLAGFLIAFGVIGTRLNIVIPAQISPVFEALPEAYHHFRNQVGYFPSWNEWLVTIFSFAMFIWVFWAACKILPLEPTGGKENA